MAHLFFALRHLLWLMSGLPRRLRRPPEYIGFLIEEPYPELPPPAGPWWQRFLQRPTMTMRDLAHGMRTVTADPRTKGVVLHLRQLQLTPAQAESLRELIAEVRAAGKRVICWAPAYTTGAYHVACAADQVLLQPGGSVGPLGLGRTYMFLAEALERVGLEADLLQISPYKAAGDVLTKKEMAPEVRQMANWLADSAFDELLEAIASGRGLSGEEARSLVGASPFTDEEALESRAVDGLVGEEDMPAHLGGRLAPWREARRLLLRPRPAPPGRRVGLIRIEGSIVDGRSGRPPYRLPVPILGEARAGDITVVQQARRLAASRSVASVLLWVDSGGGSATASEAMASALEALAAKKPLVAAMGSVAGSGGYYVVTPARRIFALPGTVTGSIGVLGGKLVVGGLLDKLLFNREEVTRGRAAMSTTERPYDDEERAKVRRSIERTYQVFLARVAKSRARTPAEVDEIGGGRVWTGRQALANGLVDELGGFERALAEARRLGGLGPRAPYVEAPAKSELAPAYRPPAALQYVLDGLAALNRASAWAICPLVNLDEG